MLTNAILDNIQDNVWIFPLRYKGWYLRVSIACRLIVPYKINEKMNWSDFELKTRNIVPYIILEMLRVNEFVSE